MILKKKFFLTAALLTTIFCFNAYASELNIPESTVENQVDIEEESNEVQTINETEITESVQNSEESSVEESSESAEETVSDEENDSEIASGAENTETSAENLIAETSDISSNENEGNLENNSEAEDAEDDNITILETDPVVDENGFVTLEVTAADDVILPVTVTMNGSEGAVSFTLEYNGQQIKMKPDTYKLTKVINGEGKKLDDGAYLTITDEGGQVYLDFNKPESTGFNMKNFIISNILFVPLMFILWLGFKWYRKHLM